MDNKTCYAQILSLSTCAFREREEEEEMEMERNKLQIMGWEAQKLAGKLFPCI